MHGEAYSGDFALHHHARIQLTGSRLESVPDHWGYKMTL